MRKAAKMFEAAEHAPGRVAIAHDGTRMPLRKRSGCSCSRPGWYSNSTIGRVLAVQRHAVGILGRQDRGQGARAGIAAGDRLCRHCAGDDLARLAVSVALAAGVFKSNPLLQCRRVPFQFADVVAKRGRDGGKKVGEMHARDCTRAIRVLGLGPAHVF